MDVSSIELIPEELTEKAAPSSFESEIAVAPGPGTTELRAEDSEEFYMEFVGDSMFLFLDDDEGAISLSFGEEVVDDDDHQVELAHFLEKTKKNPKFMEDMENVSSVCEYIICSL